MKRKKCKWQSGNFKPCRKHRRRFGWTHEKYPLMHECPYCHANIRKEAKDEQ